MSFLKCCLCFQPSNDFPEYFKTVLTDAIRLFNKHSLSLERIKVDKLAVCKSCWICIMQLHQFDHELRVKKTTCDAKKAFLASKIRRAQSSFADSGNILQSCENFEAQSSTNEDTEDIEEDLVVSGQTKDEQTHPRLENQDTKASPRSPMRSPLQSPCNITLKDAEDSDAESIELYEITNVITPASDSLSTAASSAEEDQVEATSEVTSESLDSESEPDKSNEDPTEAMSVDTSDSQTDSESEPSKSHRITSKSEGLRRNKKSSSGWRMRSSNVKQLSETDFTYMNKYPFTRTDAGFKCGLCPVISNVYNASSRIEYNALKHIHRWHISTRERSKRAVRRFIEIGPNRFQYGKYTAELVDGNYRCEECGELSADRTRDKRPTKRNIIFHIMRHHENPSQTYVCEHCGNIYRTTFALSEHKAAKHDNKDGPFPCSECGKTFLTRKRTSKHQQEVHGTKKKFICEICGKECSQKSILANHIAFVHNGHKLKCNDCDKVFGSKVALSIHRHCHLGTKFTCDICGMEFSQQSSIRRHKKTAHSQ